MHLVQPGTQVDYWPVGKNGAPSHVPLSCTHKKLPIVKVHILDTQPQAFRLSYASSVKQVRNEAINAMHFRKPRTSHCWFKTTVSRHGRFARTASSGSQACTPVLSGTEKG